MALAPAVTVDADELIATRNDFMIGATRRMQVRASQAQRQEEERSDPRLQADGEEAGAHRALFITQEV